MLAYIGRKDFAIDSRKRTHNNKKASEAARNHMVCKYCELQGNCSLSAQNVRMFY